MNFDVKNYRKACKYYYEEWHLADETLYLLCKNNPDHTDKSSINAKFFIIGRSYAAGIERIRANSGGQTSGVLRQLTEYIFKKQKDMETIFKSFSVIKEPLTEKQLLIIIEAHGKFTNFLKENLGGAPRSFASKYLHFHCPAFPIYDSIASRQLAKGHRWDKDLKLFDMPEATDKDYFRFVMRFWRLYQDLKDAGEEVNVKLVDNYLMWNDEDDKQSR